MFPQQFLQNQTKEERSSFQSFCLGSDLYQEQLSYRFLSDFLKQNKQLQILGPLENFVQASVNSELSGAIDQIRNQEAGPIQESSQTVSEEKNKKNKKIRRHRKKGVKWGQNDQKVNVKKDQNLCKKYNSVALKVVCKLQPKGIANLFKQKIYRQDFLIIVLMVARQCGVLYQFENIYKQQILNLRSKIQKQKPKNKQVMQKNNDLVSGINKSLAALQMFMDEKLEEARLKLFNVQKLRNKKFIQESKRLICEVQSTIYENIQELNI